MRGIRLYTIAIHSHSSYVIQKMAYISLQCTKREPHTWEQVKAYMHRLQNQEDSSLVGSGSWNGMQEAQVWTFVAVHAFTVPKCVNHAWYVAD